MTNSTPSHEDLVVNRQIEIGAETKLDGSIVLREFEGMRRDLAARLEGDSGIGLGYDVLDIRWGRLRELQPGARLVLSATLLGHNSGRHEVEYVASAADATVVRARGWTLNPLNGWVSEMARKASA